MIESSIKANYPNVYANIRKQIEPVAPLDPTKGEIETKLILSEDNDLLANIRTQYESINEQKAKKINKKVMDISVATGMISGGIVGSMVGKNLFEKSIFGTGGAILGTWLGIFAARPMESIARKAYDIVSKRKQKQDILAFLKSEGII